MLHQDAADNTLTHASELSTECKSIFFTDTTVKVHFVSINSTGFSALRRISLDYCYSDFVLTGLDRRTATVISRGSIDN